MNSFPPSKFFKIPSKTVFLHSFPSFLITIIIPSSISIPNKNSPSCRSMLFFVGVQFRRVGYCKSSSQNHTTPNGRYFDFLSTFNTCSWCLTEIRLLVLTKGLIELKLHVNTCWIYPSEWFKVLIWFYNMQKMLLLLYCLQNLTSGSYYGWFSRPNTWNRNCRNDEMVSFLLKCIV